MENMKKAFAQRSDLHVDRQRDTEVYVGSKRPGEVETANLGSSKRARLASVGTESNVSRRLQFAPPLTPSSPAVAVSFDDNWIAF